MAHKFWALIILVMIITPLGGTPVFASALETEGFSRLAGETVSISADGPDLIIDTVTLSPENPHVGDEITFSVTVKNLGNERAVSSKMEYYIDENLITYTYVTPIEPDESLTITFTWKAQAGDHTIKAVADSVQSVIESDETNNTFLFAFSVLAPDLIIEEITWHPESVSTQDKVTFTVTIKNQGNYMADCSHVNFYIDGVSRGYQDVNRLDAGATVSKTFYWTAQEGSHEIKAVADILSKVAESNEANNDKTVDYSTLAPDLVVQSLTRSPANPSAGDNVIFTVAIKNAGEGKAYSSYVAYYIDDKYFTSAYIGPLNPGAIAQRTFAWEIDKNSHTITAIADSNEKINESDETNNTGNISLPALAPDLIVQNITWSPSSPSINQYVTFTVTVKNQGHADASLSRIHFDINLLRHYSYVAGISAGATTTSMFAWKAQGGSHTITAIVDAEDSVIESNESNNTRAATISPTHPAPSDLTVQNIDWSPENPVVGEMVTFTVTVKNQGSGQAVWSNMAFYVDDIYLTSSSVGILGSGATAAIDISWEAQAGLHTINAIADSNQVLTEGNEDNNINTVNVSVLAPDLFIKAITCEPINPSPGDTITVTATVSNTGNCSAGSSFIDYFINDSPRGNYYVEDLEVGAAVIKTFTCVAPEEPYSLKVIVDGENDVHELDETNNEKSITFPVPDLVIEGISWAPENPLEGDIVTFSVALRNQSGSTVRNSDVNFYIDGSYQSSSTMDELEAGGTMLKEFAWTAQSGSHNIEVVVDEANNIIESNEFNNQKSNNITVSLPQVHTPAPAPTTQAISVSSPAVQLQDAIVSLNGDSCYVLTGEDIVLNLNAVNPMNNPMLILELVLELPPCISVISPEFIKIDDAHYTAQYSVAPGDTKLIDVYLKADEEGDYSIISHLAYYFDGDIPTKESQVLLLPVTVEGIEQQEVKPWSAILSKIEMWFNWRLVSVVAFSVAFIGLVSLLIIRRRKSQHNS